MRVEVNETNIDLFQLELLTGNSREDMLNAAAEAAREGYTLSCQIPDSSEEIKFNAFEHLDSTPAPKVEVSDQVNTYSDGCRYEQRRVLDGGEKTWICIIHHTNSRHEVIDETSRVPCLFLDPYVLED